jgi:hypothetical protein
MLIVLRRGDYSGLVDEMMIEAGSFKGMIPELFLEGRSVRQDSQFLKTRHKLKFTNKDEQSP